MALCHSVTMFAFVAVFSLTQTDCEHFVTPGALTPGEPI